METADTATVMEAWGESDCGTEIFCLIIVLLNHKAGLLQSIPLCIVLVDTDVTINVQNEDHSEFITRVHKPNQESVCCGQRES